VELALSRRAEDLAILDLRELAEFTDYFLICSGASDTQVRAIADAVLEGMKKDGTQPWHTEGYDGRRWVLLDFVDVVVHIFQPDARAFFGLERLWGDAPTESVADGPPASTPAEQAEGTP
jgi:ribosome-associated protein